MRSAWAPFPTGTPTDTVLSLSPTTALPRGVRNLWAGPDQTRTVYPVPLCPSAHSRGGKGDRGHTLIAISLNLMTPLLELFVSAENDGTEAEEH